MTDRALAHATRPPSAWSTVAADPARRAAARAAARLEKLRYDLRGIRWELRALRVEITKGSLSVRTDKSIASQTHTKGHE